MGVWGDPWGPPAGRLTGAVRAGAGASPRTLAGHSLLGLSYRLYMQSDLENKFGLFKLCYSLKKEPDMPQGFSPVFFLFLFFSNCKTLAPGDRVERKAGRGLRRGTRGLKVNFLCLFDPPCLVPF